MGDFKVVAAAALFGGLAACAQIGSGGDRPAAAGGDVCGASDLQNLVGTSVGTLDPSTLPEPRRIVFPGQMTTTDAVPERLNVEIGSDDLVARVYCG